MKHHQKNRSTGFSQIEALLGLSLLMGIGLMVFQALAGLRGWQLESDAWQELQDRTPALHRLLSRLSRQAGGQALIQQDTQWVAAPPHEPLEPGQAITWVHARALHEQPAAYPSCQNTRVWIRDASQAPALLMDQFGWVDGQLKCKDVAQGNARWQSWVEQVKNAQIWIAWREGGTESPVWQWRAGHLLSPDGLALGVRMCLTLQSASVVPRRPNPGIDCQQRPLSDQGRLWRVWSRVWALRSERP
jgi:hypothetical protein